MTSLQRLDTQVQREVQQWLDGPFDQETKDAILTLLEENPKQLEDAFYKRLHFGTGGLRSLVGIGTNRLNCYTVRMTTQALAEYLKESYSSNLSVVISYDSRHHSRSFAEEAACVLAANAITVYLFSSLRPTPLLSFACREKKTQAGIMITASHNPADYNGYKVYWSDGSQILSPHDQEIMKRIEKLSFTEKIPSTTLESPYISFLKEEIDIAYMHQVRTLQHYPQDNASQGKELQIFYSNLHGTGITLIPQILTDWGFTNLSFVKEQKEPDGDFPTVKYPNPEEKEALALGVEQLFKKQADILFATDPDADRIGVVVLHEGTPYFLTGHEIAVLCLQHICDALDKKNHLPKNSAVIKTIVTTELFRKIALSYHCQCIDLLTGFKYIAEQIQKWEEEDDSLCHYLFGAEESYGYLFGSFVRDKDGISSCAVISEMALQAKKQGKTLVDVLMEIYQKYGIHREKMVVTNFPEGKEGAEKRELLMQKLRSNPPIVLAGIEVVEIEDYLTSQRKELSTGSLEVLTLPKSDVLRLWLADGSKITIRPSGTEPKIKVYAEAFLKEYSSLKKGIIRCEKKVEELIQAVNACL